MGKRNKWLFENREEIQGTTEAKVVFSQGTVAV